jgi:hypothetical protein
LFHGHFKPSSDRGECPRRVASVAAYARAEAALAPAKWLISRGFDRGADLAHGDVAALTRPPSEVDDP